jgi:hypothetical protein
MAAPGSARVNKRGMRSDPTLSGMEDIAEQGRVTTTSAAPPLRDLVGVSGGEFARWIKITTPNDRPDVIRVLETAAAILRDELEGRYVA